MTEFTPWLSLAGGALIGVSAVLLMLTTGRVIGMSGITVRMMPPKPDFGRGMGAAFVIGVIIAAPVYHLVTGSAPMQTVSDNFPLLAVAGALVGFGAIWGSGCTSGHGVCGISRLSVRSMISTVTFMAVAIATTFIIRHVIGA